MKYKYDIWSLMVLRKCRRWLDIWQGWHLICMKSVMLIWRQSNLEMSYAILRRLGLPCRPVCGCVCAPALGIYPSRALTLSCRSTSNLKISPLLTRRFVRRSLAGGFGDQSYAAGAGNPPGSGSWSHWKPRQELVLRPGQEEELRLATWGRQDTEERLGCPGLWGNLVSQLVPWAEAGSARDNGGVVLGWGTLHPWRSRWTGGAAPSGHQLLPILHREVGSSVGGKHSWTTRRMTSHCTSMKSHLALETTWGILSPHFIERKRRLTEDLSQGG